MALTTIRWTWYWPVFVSVLGLAVTVTSLTPPANATTKTIISVIALLLVWGNVSICLESLYASRVMGGWASVYHAFPSLAKTASDPGRDPRRAAGRDLTITGGSVLVSAISIAAASAWLAFGIQDDQQPPTRDIESFIAALASVATGGGGQGIYFWTLAAGCALLIVLYSAVASSTPQYGRRAPRL